MRKLLILPIILFSWQALSQDERYFRQFFSGELESRHGSAPEKKYHFLANSPYYSIDLNSDGKLEHIVFAKKDGEDWVEIIDHADKKIFSYQLENKGHDSELFRIELRTLSNQTRVLILYYFEGVTKYIDFQGTARVYVLSIDNGDLSKIGAFKGPSFFDEVKLLKGHYHKRNYDVFLKDYNNDGVKELTVKFKNYSYVYLYSGNGKWTTFSRDF